MMNILISVDENYLKYVKSMIYSLRCCVKDDIKVFLFKNSLEKNSLEDLRNFLKNKCKACLEIIESPKGCFEGLPLGNQHFTIEMYYRLIAQFVLPSNIDRILWLDADIIVKKDITSFYYQQFDGKSMVVCPDINCNLKEIDELKCKIGLSKRHRYFNSGVLLLNLQKLREDTTIDGVLSICMDLRNKVEYPDQDILNYLYQNKVKYADELVYNFQTFEGKVARKERKRIAIIHYVGQKKPWKYKFINNMSIYYWNIQIKQGHIIEACWIYLKFSLYYLARNLYWRIKNKNEK